MQPPNCTPQQSRLLVYSIAVYACLTFFALSFAHTAVSASELPPIRHHHSLGESVPHALHDDHTPQSEPNNRDRDFSENYTPDFDYLDRSLIGRQVAEVDKLTRNEAVQKEIAAGVTLHFVLERDQLRFRQLEDDSREVLELRHVSNASADDAREANTGAAASAHDMDSLTKRQAAKQVWISATTCRQPVPDELGRRRRNIHPQLVMYVSNSSNNQKPGPDSTEDLATNITGILFDSGYGMFNLNTTSDIYIGIAAPELDTGWAGSWQFEIAVSTDGPYHSYNDTNPFLFMIDTDSDSALFITAPLDTSNTSEVVDKWRTQNPFQMYAFQSGVYTAITGMEHSFCALKEQFNSNTTKNFTVTSGVTTKFDTFPKSQFHVQGLDAAKTYNGFVVVDGNNATSALSGVGTVRAGGLVFQQFNWTTKADDSCQVLFDLEFCDSVAYAVPSSSNFKGNDTGLGKLYDDQAKQYFQNFTKSLAQVACDTASEAQYSLARTCKDCETDYKRWLCSVLIPRCEDWTSDDPWLRPRRINELLPNGTLPYNGDVSAEFNATFRDRFAFKQSRNAMIDEIIQPGPYKEMLPCEDLCFDIVRSCPASLGFACPNYPARALGYGKKDPKGNTLTCSYPGAVVKLNVPSVAANPDSRIRDVLLASILTAALLVF
ncbi:hypothetical protein ACN47E_004877 [Coniothyrium glycines]